MFHNWQQFQSWNGSILIWVKYPIKNALMYPIVTVYVFYKVKTGTSFFRLNWITKRCLNCQFCSIKAPPFCRVKTMPQTYWPLCLMLEHTWPNHVIVGLCHPLSVSCIITYLKLKFISILYQWIYELWSQKKISSSN